jgi:mRNA-degrading endonuclease RelE of RelBE toxin-antitoxin system
MIRAQIQFTEEEHRRLRRLAAERHISIAALVRELVERSLGEGDVQRRRRQALSTIGRFHSGKRDIGRNHDRYLDEDFEA